MDQSGPADGIPRAMSCLQLAADIVGTSDVCSRNDLSESASEDDIQAINGGTNTKLLK